MSIWDDPCAYLDVESQTCEIGSGECSDFADGPEEFGQ
jgi:hypothetical protein